MEIRRFSNLFEEIDDDGARRRNVCACTGALAYEGESVCTWNARRRAWTVERFEGGRFVFVEKLPTLAAFVRKYGEFLESSPYIGGVARYCVHVSGRGLDGYLYERAEG